MTSTQSLSKRLREIKHALAREAADALDAKDAEIALLTEGRKLHDEHADHLEAEIAELKVDLTAKRRRCNEKALEAHEP